MCRFIHTLSHTSALASRLQPHAIVATRCCGIPCSRNTNCSHADAPRHRSGPWGGEIFRKNHEDSSRHDRAAPLASSKQIFRGTFRIQKPNTEVDDLMFRHVDLVGSVRLLSTSRGPRAEKVPPTPPSEDVPVTENWELGGQFRAISFFTRGEKFLN